MQKRGETVNERKTVLKTVLIVDDIAENIHVLAGALEENYRVKAALNGRKALEIAEDLPPPDIILLDIMMPGMDGYEVAQKLGENPATKDIPFVFITSMDEVEDERRGFELGALDYLTKPISPPIVRARVENLLALRMHQSRLEEIVEKRTEELRLTREFAIATLAALAETRSNETNGHIFRTQRFLLVLANTIRNSGRYRRLLNDHYVNHLYDSAPLHDIGKVGIPDAILLKTTPLTEEERIIMRRHTTYGRDTLLRAERSINNPAVSSFLHLAREIAYTHHERWDGSGYPRGLCKGHIPFSGRIMAIADVYDALTSPRTYKPALPHKTAVEYLCDNSGRYFDPELIEAFMHCEGQFARIAKEYDEIREKQEIRS